MRDFARPKLSIRTLNALTGCLGSRDRHHGAKTFGRRPVRTDERRFHGAFRPLYVYRRDVAASAITTAISKIDHGSKGRVASSFSGAIATDGTESIGLRGNCRVLRSQTVVQNFRGRL